MKFSIITSTYNASSYIKHYFEQLEEQIYKNFEIIMVDDCSNDDTVHKIKKYMNKSPMDIKLYINISNLGPGGARNVGIEKANGENVVFLDIDDLIDNSTLSCLKDMTEYDCVIFDFFKISSDRKRKVYSKGIYGCKEGRISKEKALRDSIGAVWGKMYKLSIIKQNNIKFPELLKSEDLVFVKLYLLHCIDIFYMEMPLYFYMINRTSIINSNIENQLVYGQEAINTLKEILKGYDEVYEIIYNREIIYDFTIILIKLGKSRNELNEFWNRNYFSWKSTLHIHSYTKVQLIVLLMVRLKMYFCIKHIVNIK